MRVVFLGTSSFALPSLEALVSAEDIDSLIVISRPDRPSGRGRKLSKPPVASRALELGLNLLQPRKLREVADVIGDFVPDVMVSASYGGWLPEWFLGVAPLGVVNIHPSLLPRHRGAAPIIRTILRGDGITGVSFMLTDNGWDTGDILYTLRHKTTGNETAGELETTLSRIAAESLPQVLRDYASGKLVPVPQQGEASYAEKVTPSESVLLWSDTAEIVVRKVLAFNPAPGARTHFNSGMLKIHRASLSGLSGSPGEVVEINPFVVACGDGAVAVTEVQPEGKRRMTSDEFIRGYRLLKGSILGEA